MIGKIKFIWNMLDESYVKIIVKLLIYWSKKYFPDPYDFDKSIYCHQDDDPEHLILDRDYYAYGNTVKAPFEWDGSSSPDSPLIRWLVAKFYKSLKRSVWHDDMCAKAKNNHDRLVADIGFFLLSYFAEKVSPTKCLLGLLGVRIGARLGIGNNF